jgi:hypothetical protein
MRTFKIILFTLSIISVVSAQEKSSKFGFSIKPGISFLGKNTFTNSTFQSSALEMSAGIIILERFFIDYAGIEFKARNKIDNSKLYFRLNSLRFGLLHLFPINEKTFLRVSTGFSINTSNLVAGDPFGYFSSIGFEREINENGLNYFLEIQYDLINHQDENFNGNLGGTKIYLGLKFIAKK